MKKEKLITRTIISTLAFVKYYDVTEKMVHDSFFTLAGKLDEKEVIAEMNDMFNMDYENNPIENKKFIMVLDITYQEKLYGVTESAFLEIAKELPPRKANETQEEE